MEDFTLSLNDFEQLVQALGLEYRCCVNCNRDTDQKPVDFENELGEPLCEDCYEDEKDER